MLARYAADTWRSFELLLDPATGLPSDNVSAAGERSRYTSPTNVGAYLWSTPAARDTGPISVAEARRRIAATLASVARLERHQPSGMFYNWYDLSTGAKLTTWPVDGSPVYPFLSSVDNGWMAAALLMASEHGLEEAGCGYWGFSPSNNPSGGYRKYGVDAIGLNPTGTPPNNDNTLVDYGFGDCRPAQPLPSPRPTPTGW